MQNPQASRRLTDDPRLQLMGCGSVLSIVLMAVVPAFILAGAFVASRLNISTEPFISPAFAAVASLFVLWLALFIGVRIAFVHSAVSLSGATPRAEARSYLDGSAEAMAEAPEVTLTMRVQSSLGRQGTCQVALYSDRIQLTRGTGKLAWQFSYRDLVQAESVNLATVEARNKSDQSYVRLVVSRPRIALLLGAPWLGLKTRQNRSAGLLVEKLRAHGVPIFNETVIA